MVKAIFLDYTGTVMKEQNRYTLEVARMIAAHSSLHDLPEIFRVWWSIIKELEDASYMDAYMTEDQIARKALDILSEKYDFQGNHEEFIELAHAFWSKSPAFEDVKEFFEQCPLPIYMITNNGVEYVNVFLQDNGLRCAGVICGDMVKAYKPHRELFQKALTVSGCSADEVIHIGDSVVSDVKGAQGVGIRPILLDREGKDASDEYLTMGSLREVLSLLHKEDSLY